MAVWLAVLVAGATVNVRDHGAVGDGVTLDSAAIQSALDACGTAGGGVVHVPPGTYLAAGLRLPSGVTLNLQRGATLLGSRDLADYTGGYLLQCDDGERVGLTGDGTVDGQGEHFWEFAATLDVLPWNSAAQHEWRALSRPAFIRFRRCRDVTVRGVTLTGAPSWTLHLNRCDGALVDGLTIRNPLYGPNTDGIDINMCRRVTVRGCDIVTGDDGVVLKSSDPGHDAPSSDILVEDCRIQSATNCLKLGTETHGSFDRITFRRCRLYADTTRALDRPHSGVSIESVDGSRVSDVLCEDLTIDNARAALFVRVGHRGGNSERTRQVEPRQPGSITNVTFRRVTATRAMMESSIVGLPGHPVRGVVLEQVSIGGEGGGHADWALGEVPEDEARGRYPEANMFGRLPAHGLYARHVDGLRLDDVALTVDAPDPRPALVADDVAELRVRRLSTSPGAGRFPVLWLRGVNGAGIADSIAPRGTATYILAEASTDVSTARCQVTAAMRELEFGEAGALWRASAPEVTESAPGRFVVEAEALGWLAPMVAADEPGASGGRVVTVPRAAGRNAGLARLRFTVTTAGRYRVWVRVLAPDGESDSLVVGVDDRPRVTSDIRRTGEWLWDEIRDRRDDRVAWDNVAEWRLEAGEHLLTVRGREPGWRLDQVLIALAGETP